MTTFFIRLLASTFGLFVADRLVTGVAIDGLYTALVVALLLGVFNTIVRPILVVLTLPVTILTLGLFLFVLNALIFWFVGSFVDGFVVDGFLPALLGSLVVSTVSWLTHKII
ncbi:MAG: phage holin family protein [Candidatus Pacebacteria bacterium]|nr:phage holin family protein [Candidatus Paceibacterota bacterium]